MLRDLWLTFLGGSIYPMARIFSVSSTTPNFRGNREPSWITSKLWWCHDGRGKEGFKERDVGKITWFLLLVWLLLLKARWKRPSKICLVMRGKGQSGLCSADVSFTVFLRIQLLSQKISSRQKGSHDQTHLGNAWWTQDWALFLTQAWVEAGANRVMHTAFPEGHCAPHPGDWVV